MKQENTEIASEAVAYLASALDARVAFLQANYPVLPDSDPLDFGLFWDPSDAGRGDMAKCNLAEEMLDVFKDDPAYYRPAMPAAIAALRKLADDIEAIHAAAPIQAEVWPANERTRVLAELTTQQ